MKDLVIISGGQTGVDQAALEVGHHYGYALDGYAPKNYITELGIQRALLQGKYGLREHQSQNYSARTVSNVEMADGVLIIGKTSSRGTQLTRELCLSKKKPMLVNPLKASEIKAWIEAHGIKKLMVAGNRMSVSPKAASVCTELLTELLAHDIFGQNIVAVRHGFEAGFLAGFASTDSEWNGDLDAGDGSIGTDSRFKAQYRLAWDYYKKNIQDAEKDT